MAPQGLSGEMDSGLALRAPRNDKNKVCESLLSTGKTSASFRFLAARTYIGGVSAPAERKATSTQMKI